VSDFERLHPSIQHHVVNTLGWPGLRPLQAAAIEPVLAGHHGLLLAPTAGGKTEAAAFPVFSRIATEGWRPLSVLYLAPLRALLNNLLPRLERYASFTGHRVALWHGDIGPGERKRIIADPPDVLLTTPESLEAMLISRRVNERWLFPHLRTVVIDEVHAFASADRGWHLLAVLERVSRLAGRELQRIGLSATVGNPGELLAWLTQTCTLPKVVVNPPAGSLAEPEVGLDYVGSLDNAATVISRLHREEKRLVFVDSRRRAEELTRALRGRGIATFVSHGSLGRDQRQRAERAFAEATDCVIVATSTLELGIDVGDLDRVIQIDSPPTVAGFLQRIGRTGRRTGASRNALVLALSEGSLFQSAGLLRLWRQGYVESALPPVFPAHLLVHQVLALALQEADHGLGQQTWPEWLGRPFVLGADVLGRAGGLVDHLLAQGWLHADSGLLGPGPRAEATIGRRSFLELTSVFVSDPLLSVRQGRLEVGQVPDIAISSAFAQRQGPPALLLAGRSWRIREVDWKRRVVRVEPADDRASVQFRGTAQPLSFGMCQSIAAVYAGEDPDVELSKRASARLGEGRQHLLGVQPGRTALVSGRGRTCWYTFAGLRANLELAARLHGLRDQVHQRDNLWISLSSDVRPQDITTALRLDTPTEELERLVANVSGDLTLDEVLPDALVQEIRVRRFSDHAAIAATVDAPLDSFRRE
jgi:ATP-dependent Lhr-like helicase